MTPRRLALASLLHDRGRAAVSVVGAAFAVLLVFMQLGFLGATVATATVLYGKLDYDVLLMSREYLEFSRPGSLDRARVAQARGVPGVAAVRPVSVGQGLWRNPTGRDADPKYGGRRAAIVLLGVAPADAPSVFAPAVFGGTGADRELTRLDTVLLDRRSRPDFGRPPAGTPVELNGRRVELAGYFAVGTGFSYTGLTLMNDETFARTTGKPQRETTFGLVKLAPGADPAVTAQAIEAALPPDIRAVPRAAIEQQERDYWGTKTAVGKLFTAGVVLALSVGAIFVYQMIAADIKTHLPEYATLKAVGYEFGFLFRVVVWQAVFLAAGGYVLGLAAALVLYEVTVAAANLPMAMTGGRLATVLGLTLTMCVGSGLVAVRKVKTADPADLF